MFFNSKFGEMRLFRDPGIRKGDRYYTNFYNIIIAHKLCS